MPGQGFRPKARRPRGLEDRRGPALARERAAIEAISKVYEKWGFEALETPALEYADALGKFLPDQDRPNEGVFAFADDDEQWLSLRYDLTAPLARFVAENYDALPKPYRRWAAGPVWRNEKPGPGRYRQFWQCDADTVGSASPAADAEMIAMAGDALEAAGLDRNDYRLKINSRKILDGALEAIGLAGEDQFAKRLKVLRAIDKLDRLRLDGVKELLGKGRKDESGDFTLGAELSIEQVGVIEQFIIHTQVLGFGSAGANTAVDQLRRGERSPIPNPPGEYSEPDSEMTLRAWGDVVGNTETGKRGLDELAETIMLLRSGFDRGARRGYLDGTVVRGLEYYTGTVFEAEFTKVAANGKLISFGSVGGGGRYDDLVARFRGERVPATGFSIGVSRLVAALEAADSADTASSGPVVILALEADQMSEYFAMASDLRNAGVRAEVYLGGSGMRAQMKYADKRRAPLAVIVGGDERAKGVVTVKDLKLGAEMSKTIADNEEWRKGRPAQIEAPRAELVATVKRMLDIS